MKYQLSWLIGSVVLSCSALAQEHVIITPYIGFTGGGKVEGGNSRTYDINPAANYALTVEAPIEMGRLGLFYSNQPTDLQHVNNSASIHYLQFQSSIYYPFSPVWHSYLGLGIGASYADVSWVESNYGFSATAFAGVEYSFSKNVALTAQVRWLGTAVDNDTSGACQYPNGSSPCFIKFETAWMNQFQSNIGVSFHF